MTSIARDYSNVASLILVANHSLNQLRVYPRHSHKVMNDRVPNAVEDLPADLALAAANVQ
ncbi:hypothetical protein DFAR_910011 [Desulfarculales bacterium]